MDSDPDQIIECIKNIIEQKKQLHELFFKSLDLLDNWKHKSRLSTFTICFINMHKQQRELINNIINFAPEGTGYTEAMINYHKLIASNNDHDFQTDKK